MRSLAPILAVALFSLTGCGQKSDGPATSASGTATAVATASAAPTATAAANVTCDAVLANLGNLTKVDADGKKLFGAVCEGEPQPVRACMAAAKTMKDFDACDPHPLKGAAKSDAPTLTAADLVDTDLSSADASWKGWTAKGPKDAKVMADGVKGARIAGANVMAFDIAFAQGKTKLDLKKKGIQAGQKAMGADVKINFSEDTSDKLEWVTEVAGTKVWHFSRNMKVSGKDVNCSTGTMGAASEAQVALLKSSCDSLKKK